LLSLLLYFLIATLVTLFFYSSPSRLFSYSLLTIGRMSPASTSGRQYWLTWLWLITLWLHLVTTCSFRLLELSKFLWAKNFLGCKVIVWSDCYFPPGKVLAYRINWKVLSIPLVLRSASRHNLYVGISIVEKSLVQLKRWKCNGFFGRATPTPTRNRARETHITHHTKTNNDDVVPARLLGGVPEPVASIKGKIVARWTKALTLRVGRAWVCRCSLTGSLFYVQFPLQRTSPLQPSASMMCRRDLFSPRAAAADRPPLIAESNAARFRT
jgi:hypothetical protein